MFEGIIQDVGTVIAILKRGGGMVVKIESALDMDSIEPGKSLCCSGSCLTVTSVEEGGVMEFDVSKDTLAATNFSHWEIGSLVNLEKPIKLGDEVSGYIIQGHVDCTAEVIEIEADNEHHRMTLCGEDSVIPYIVLKGGIVIEGIAMTINKIENNCFTVNVIPYTYRNTALRCTKVGDSCNIEIDMFARYLLNAKEHFHSTPLKKFT